jgi:hypothetical protein
MTIGNWSIKVLGEMLVNTRPGDYLRGNVQKRITYDFLYKPLDLHVVRTIQFTRPHSEVNVEQVLKEFLSELEHFEITELIRRGKRND